MKKEKEILYDISMTEADDQLSIFMDNFMCDKGYFLLTKILLSVVYFAFGLVHPQEHKHLLLG